MNMLQISKDAIVNLDHVKSINSAEDHGPRIDFWLSDNICCRKPFGTVGERDEYFVKLAKKIGANEIDGV